jgi:hypothetical protein
MIEEMCASYWRQRRAWAIETALLDKQIALQPDGANSERLAAAFDRLAAAPTLPLLHRYDTRQHLMYQRALRTLIMLRTVKNPNDPSPISEHPPDAIAPSAPAVGQPILAAAGFQPAIVPPKPPLPPLATTPQACDRPPGLSSRTAPRTPSSSPPHPGNLVVVKDNSNPQARPEPDASLHPNCITLNFKPTAARTPLPELPKQQPNAATANYHRCLQARRVRGPLQPHRRRSCQGRCIGGIARASVAIRPGQSATTGPKIDIELRLVREANAFNSCIPHLLPSAIP